MPQTLSFDLKQLVRVCLNDPDLRAEIVAALAEDPLPVRSPVANVTEGAAVFAALLRTDREKAPGDAGFLARDSLGWVTGKLQEIVQTDSDASTITTDSMAERMRKPQP